MKKIAVFTIGFLMVVMGVAHNNWAGTDNEKKGPSTSHGFGTALTGLAHLVLSPIQIAAGIAEGISSIPFYLSTSIHELNKGLITAQSKITLDDTYDAAYGKRLSEVKADGNTGDVFRRMKHATVYFQKILKQYGVANYENYILTSIDTASSKGYTLFAVVYRPSKTIEVLDKYDGKTRRSFSFDDRLYYEPFETSVNGSKLDTIIDWTGIARKSVESQKGQAILLTMAANAVIEAKRTETYWGVEKRWVTGDYQQIVDTRMKEVGSKMQVQTSNSDS